MIGFIRHNKVDQVGVAVKDLKEGETVEGWTMEDDSTLSVTARQDIPLGHKIAVSARAKGDVVLKYGVSIGIASESFEVGDHVHTHNLKTARW
jgi:(2R)-sulfolactate sulfo-lyase subunit alpha